MVITSIKNNKIKSQLFSVVFGQHIGYRIPSDYFFKNNTWVLFDNKKRLMGGFALVNKNQRVIDELPENYPKEILSCCCAELTGYFLDSKAGSFKLTARLALEVIKSEKKYFVYAYPSNNKKLENYYLMGDPIRIYTGLPITIAEHPKMTTIEAQNVEILTKYGIVKLFLRRTIKHYLFTKRRKK